MPRASTAPPFERMYDLLAALGGISPKRVRLDPAPGTATEKDVIRWLHAADKRLYELVDGTLVEKAVSYDASVVGGKILQLIANFSDDNGDFGVVAGADGAVKFMKGLVRFPDVSFVRLDRFPGGVVPKQPIIDLAPDLAVEVLSPSNTRGEITRKLKEYFLAGVRLVWVADPDSHTVRVFTAPDAVTELTEQHTLTGGDVLPGFAVSVAKLFAKLPPAKPKKPARRKKPG
ncbi:MAG: Uma2 family endonuclease [Fimbriiglobus sp.]